MPTPPASGLPELPEASATGEIARLYADMRAVLQVPVVNLIWRHIATLPGALPWCWALLRPAYASGAVEAAATQVVTGLRLPPLRPMPSGAWVDTGVSPADVPMIGHLVATYHRANPLNLVALSTLLAHLQSGSVQGAASVSLRSAGYPAETARPAAADSPPARAAPAAPLAAPPAAPPAAVPPPLALPPLLTATDMPPTTAALAWRLAALGVPGTVEELPSVWRHLAHWPGYLEWALALLGPLAADGWLAQEMDGVRARRDAAAAGLLTTAHRPAAALGAPPAPAVAAALATVLHRFTDGLIVRMIPLVAVLQATLPPMAGSRR